jgi:flagellar hook-associated protein 2
MSSSAVPGSNVPPISFPGIVSGIDYNSIITKLTTLSLQPTTALNAQVATLNSANVELTNINNLLTSVQNSLANLSNPDLYDAYGATSTDPTALTATGVPGTAAVPGAYVINATKTATSSTITGSATAGHSITDLITSGPFAGDASNTVPLADSYASVVPTNGSNGKLGQITVDGVAVTYNVGAQSLDNILNNITSAVRTSADSGFLATLVGGVVEFTSSDQPISIGSSGDNGNLTDVLQITNAQLNNTPTSGSISGTANVGGVNPDLSFDTTTSAGYKTPVTGGFFTINGVRITVQTTQNTADIVNAINASGAGVVASINSATNQITLAASQTGPQGIVLGASGDTSNFLTAAGLTTAAGSTTKIGSQAEVDVLNADASITKYFSNSNTITTAIPGISLNIQSSTTTPFTVTVAQSTTQLVSAVSSFISTYNQAIAEINKATAPPIITAAGLGSGGAAQSIPGGVLYGNSNVQSVVYQLTDIVSGVLGSGTSYNSLSQIGLTLDDQFTTFTSGNNSDATGDTGGSSAGGANSTSPVQSTTFEGTDGQLQALDTTKFLTAFESNPSGVLNLLNGSNGLTTQLGTYLTSVTGAPTLLDAGPVGTIPTISLLQNYENTNTDSISSLQQQIQQLTDNANSQANNLRAQFVASESLIAQLQAEQQELGAALGFSVAPSSQSGSSGT